MGKKKFMVPVGVAVTTLLSCTSYADRVSAEVQQDSPGQDARIENGKLSIDPVLQRLTYQIRAQAHDLTLHKSSSETIYAEHGSHRSHADHYSHRSGS